MSNRGEARVLEQGMHQDVCWYELAWLCDSILLLFFFYTLMKLLYKTSTLVKKKKVCYPEQTCV